ncbi:cyclin domain-containing protein [Sarocladium implicatum]|nr:cyclin domain-containing protein [Sarocladium implicatum]
MQAQTEQPPHHTIQLHQDSSASSDSVHDLPPPPVPSSDPHLLPNGQDASSASQRAPDSADLFELPALEAVKLLSAHIEVLVRMTGDIPPTPPLKHSTDPQMSGMQAEKDSIARTHSEQSLARLAQQAQADANKSTSRPQSSAGQPGDPNKVQAYNNALRAKLSAQQASHGALSTVQDLDGVQLKKGLTSPLSPPGSNPQPYVVIGADSQPLNLQHGAITRKFYSKNEPPITITAYLLRLHQFCPMSTAVYLATSLYIHRLAIEERAIPVTRRNAHRLVLAGLRVAMKALEDLSYSHSKIAKVGGVSELELARLEVSFCFLTGFELVVGEEKLRTHWESLRNGKAQQILSGMEVPTLRLIRKPKKVNPPPDG